MFTRKQDRNVAGLDSTCLGARRVSIDDRSDCPTSTAQDSPIKGIVNNVVCSQPNEAGRKARGET